MIIGEEEMKNERQLLTVEDGPLMQGRESVRYLILHCSATRCDKDYTAEQLLRDHKTRGFRTVGYHFYIRRDGTITQHRKLLEVGALPSALPHLTTAIFSSGLKIQEKDFPHI